MIDLKRFAPVKYRERFYTCKHKLYKQKSLTPLNVQHRMILNHNGFFNSYFPLVIKYFLLIFIFLLSANINTNFLPHLRP